MMIRLCRYAALICFVGVIVSLFVDEHYKTGCVLAGLLFMALGMYVSFRSMVKDKLEKELGLVLKQHVREHRGRVKEIDSLKHQLWGLEAELEDREAELRQWDSSWTKPIGGRGKR